MCKCKEKYDLSRTIELAKKLAAQLQCNTVVYKSFDGYNFCTENHANVNVSYENIVEKIVWQPK